MDCFRVYSSQCVSFCVPLFPRIFTKCSCLQLGEKDLWALQMCYDMSYGRYNYNGTMKHKEQRRWRRGWQDDQSCPLSVLPECQHFIFCPALWSPAQCLARFTPASHPPTAAPCHLVLFHYPSFFYLHILAILQVYFRHCDAVGI